MRLRPQPGQGRARIGAERRTPRWGVRASFRRPAWAGKSLSDYSNKIKAPVYSFTANGKFDIIYRFYADGEYIDAGENYPGRRTDTKGHRAYLSYRVFKPQWLWVYNHKMISNPKKDPAKDWNDNERNEIGSSFNIKGMPFFSLSYQINTSKSEKVTALSDTEEKAVIFRSNKTLGRIMASIDTKWSKEKDDATAADTKSSEYTARVSGRWQRFSPWVGYTYNTEKDIAQSSNEATIRKEFGLLYQPESKFYSSLSFSQEGTGSETPKDLLSFDMTYIPVEDMSFTLEGEMRDNHDEFNRDWQVWLTCKRSFDLPVPIKLKGIVAGIVFIDRNNNGVFDSPDTAMPKITMLLADERKDTGKDGRYKFPAANPGEIYLDIDIASLPVGLAPSVILPYKIDLGIGKTKVVNIPLLKTARVRGIVFEDINKDGKKDADEKGLSLIRIVITDASLKQKDTFSDNNGSYSFAGVIPGKYDVRIDTKWLPSRFALTTVESVSIDLSQGTEKAANFLQSERLLNCTMYSTLEPCSMCAGAMVLSRIKSLIYAAKDPKTGAHESVFKILNNKKLNHKVRVKKGVLENESSALIKEFFKIKRKNLFINDTIHSKN